MAKMKRILLMVVTAVMTTSALAQIPDKVKEVMRKSDEKMASYNTAAGTVIEGTVKMKVSIISFNGPLKMYAKNKKFFATLSMNAMKEIGINVDVGFDGEQKWEYRTVTGDESKKKDTLRITKTRDAKNTFGPKTHYDKDYKKATMKEVGRYYEITFSGPLKKGTPKKSSIKIDKENYLVREYSVDENVGPYTAKMTVTLTKITKGCSDNWLKLDMNRYKNAVVVRK
ncbi:MAG: hypothetical protein J6Z10_05920 [Prevotella sp.]|nr:hypothetical protein [Prevotella sp.]